MKKLLLIGWVMLLGGFLFMARTRESELPVYDAANVSLRSVKGVWMRDRKPFTGTVISYTTSRDTLSVSCYHDGLEDGEWKTFYDSGKLRSLRFYDRGKKTGTVTSWHDNGKLQVTATFVNDEYEGELREWDSAGQLLKLLTYSQGHEAGRQRAWYPDGKVRSNYTVIDGRRYGLLGTKHCINVSDSIRSL